MISLAPKFWERTIPKVKVKVFTLDTIMMPDIMIQDSADEKNHRLNKLNSLSKSYKTLKLLF